MLRNVDKCEALILTRDVAIDALTDEVRPGVARLIAEARSIDALVALLEPKDRPISDDSPIRKVPGGMPCWTFSTSVPETTELTRLREALNVEHPDGFGGSDGFGQAPGTAYGREPIATRCVVLVTSLDEVVAALGAGMRTVGLPAHEDDWVDEALDGYADVCLDAVGEENDPLALRIDDLSTPGAYWLNPTLPRDLRGVMVDPQTGIAFDYDGAADAAPTDSNRRGAANTASSAAAVDGMVSADSDTTEEAALRAMLADVEPPNTFRPPARPPPPPPPQVPPPPAAAARRASSSRCAPPRAMLDVEPADAASRLKGERLAVLLDVRQPAEFRLDGHVEGSDNVPAYTWEHGFYLPKEGFAEEVAETHALDAPLIVLCADGRLARGAAAVLEAAAFSDVSVVAGGMRAWAEEAEEDEAVPPVVVNEDGEGGLTGEGAWV